MATEHYEKKYITIKTKPEMQKLQRELKEDRSAKIKINNVK